METPRNEDARKVQQHLSLLREQYVKLQEKCLTLEQKLALACASSSNNDNQDSFISRLLKFVSSLYDQAEYSDVIIHLSEGDIKAHKFVLAARGNNWGVPVLADVKMIDWRHLDEGVGSALLHWVYTDHIILTDHQLSLKIIKAAASFQLCSLMERCEETLIGNVNVRNCVQLFSTAEEIGAQSLKSHCSSLISTHWNDFTSQDFEHMSAPFLYDMFKSKTKYLLQAAVRLQREDVLFLYLIEFDSQLPTILNQSDDSGRLGLDLALESQNIDIANTLIKHGACVDAINPQGDSLLHSALNRGDFFAASFLLDQKCDLSLRDGHKRQPLHVLAGSRYPDGEPQAIEVAHKMLAKGAAPNAQDQALKTPLHLSIEFDKCSLFDLLLAQPTIQLDQCDQQQHTPLWYSLIASQEFDDDCLASKLIQKGAAMNLKMECKGDSMLHLLIKEKREQAAIFLTNQGASVSLVNFKGETALHLSCTYGLPNLTAALLKGGANPNSRTTPLSPSHAVSNGGPDHNPFEDENENLYRESPLHRTVRHLNMADATVILEHLAHLESCKDSQLIKPILDLENSEGLTPLGCALLNGHIDMATKLRKFGANVNQLSPEGLTLLHRSILQRNAPMAVFLLSHGADPNVRTQEGASPVQLCIEHCLAGVVETLCHSGADLSATSPSWPETPLWMALDKQHNDIASILVGNAVDVDGWSEGPDGCSQTLLHRAIDENREDVACFLVRSGCDVNALRMQGVGGQGADSADDQQTPLHMCCSWGLLDTAKQLVQFGAKINVKDAESKTSLHVALENGHQELISLLLDQSTLDLEVKDAKGKSAFAVAMATKNNKAAQAILDRFPPAAEQYDNRGQTFLHVAVHKGDLESVLFLLGIHVNLTCKTKDDRAYTPLHIATVQGNEMIVRNLLLAGADVHQLTPQKETCLHLSAREDHPHLVPIFIDNGVHCDALDTNLNNALHVAVKEGHLSCVKALLTDSQINAGAVNLRGQNPLHILAAYPKDNAAAIGQLFLDALPDYPIDSTDVEGNTALLLAYVRGSGQLCRVLVRAGACLGSTNKQGVHLFNYEVATKTLMGRLLDCISVEPPWSDGDSCLECGCKFGLATRKHHCRHCGRLLCSKCSGKEVPIIKFHINKPVRVCQMCFEVLTLGATAFS